MTMAVQSAPEVLSIQHVWAGYDRETILEDITLSVYERDFIGLIGPNGGGKTTLLKVILGLLPPQRGDVRIMGQSVRVGRRYIGYVPQLAEFDRAFPISVWDVACMGRLVRRGLFRRYTAADNAIVELALRRVAMLEHRHRPIGALSTGQRQRVYIARALATEPTLLLLDEPTASVDPHMRTSIYELLQVLNQQITILLVSHDVGAISAHVKTVGCLNRRLYYHHERQITSEMLEAVYQCPIDLIAHGVPHRVVAPHPQQGESND